MTAWPMWSPAEPTALLRYVQTDIVSLVMPTGVMLPGRSSAPAELRLSRVFDAFAAAGTDYADESFTTSDGQRIRPPDEVFLLPRHANCLDLCVAFAGACLDAGLHPIIVTLDPTGPTSPGHAIVVVWLRGTWPGPGGADDYPLHGNYGDDVVLPRQPAWPGTGLRERWDAPGEFVAVDIAGIARVWRTTESFTLDDAVSAGSAFLTGGRWRWRHGIDIGLGYEPSSALAMPGWPSVPVLEPPYRSPATLRGPLAHIRARNNVVRFEDRGELDALLRWCAAPAAAQLPRAVSIIGVGGSGKTRLAAELAECLSREGWHAGFLRNDLVPGSAEAMAAHRWLARLASPLLLVVDYVEAIATETLASLFRALAIRQRPTVVVLTARGTGDWSAAFDRALDKSGTLILRHPNVVLAARHPNPDAVFRRAYRRFATLTDAPGDPGVAPPGGLRQWTTLDLILHAWIAAHKITELPGSQADLHDQIMARELDTWVDAIGSRGHPTVARKPLRRIAASVSLLAPEAAALAELLEAVNAHHETGVPTAALEEILRPLLSDTYEVRLGVRPDPLADRLIVDVFGTDSVFFDTVTDLAENNGGEGLVRALTRAAEGDPATATMLASRVLTRHPTWWPAALAIALTEGGPFIPPLENLARVPDSPLPFGELAETIPHQHAGLGSLALIAVTHVLDATPAPTSDAERQRLAVLLQNLSVRRSDAGDRSGALTSARESVEIRQHLVEHASSTYVVDLAASLNNLAHRQTDVGDRTGALASATEAVRYYRATAKIAPTVVLPNLARSLAGLSSKQAEMGDPAGAFASVAEAVGIWRQLTSTNPAEFTTSLANSLNNLSNQQADNGDPAAALASATEATTIWRRLAEVKPAAHRSAMAGTLNNLSLRQSEMGDPIQALASIAEAATIHRQLATTNPAAFLPDLADSLNNVASQQAANGNTTAALATITEAATIHRQLATTNPKAFLPKLADSLNNLAIHQAHTRLQKGALASISEAVGIRRQLATANPKAFTADLANALNNLANQQAANGNTTAALATITEATTIHRQLATTNPNAFLPKLADSLSNLSIRLAETGDNAGALASMTEAVEHYRRLVRTAAAAYLPKLSNSLINLSAWQAATGNLTAALATNIEAVGYYRTLIETAPVTYVPDLASSLSNLSTRQTDTGDRAAALASITEAVAIRRRLAQAAPDAFRGELAGSLTNLSNKLADVGDTFAALGIGTEAVGHYRALAVTNPIAFAGGLASSLNNLSLRQAESEDLVGALTSMTEAVTIVRQRVQANSGSRSDLGTLLNNLSVRQAAVGDHAKALASIREAVTIRRALAERNPSGSLPDLASSLNNLALRKAEDGDPAGALANTTEAIDHYRALAASNRAFLPHLAGSSHNRCNQLIAIGERALALASITEAVDIRSQLAEANPRVFLPDLAASLRILSRLRVDSGDRTGALRCWRETWEQLGSPAARAFLAIGRYRWRLQDAKESDLADDDITLAAALADQPGSDLVLLGGIRQQIRQIARASEALDLRDLPDWITVDIDDRDDELLNAWFSLRNWADRCEFLRSHWTVLANDHTRALVTTTRDLNPHTADRFITLANLILLVKAEGLENVLSDLIAQDAANTLVTAWVAKSTWTESQRFLQQHPELRTNQRHMNVLAERNDPTLYQHLAILALTRHYPINEVYDAVVDLTDARDLLLAVVADGDPDLVRAMWMASPLLRGDDFAAPFAVAVIHALADDTPSEKLTIATQEAKAAASTRDLGRAIRALRAAAVGRNVRQLQILIDTMAQGETS